MKLGYCLPPDQQETIVSNPPINADAFVDAVLAAEGRDPAYISEEERRPMIQIVTRFVYGDGAHR